MPRLSCLEIVERTARWGRPHSQRSEGDAPPPNHRCAVARDLRSQQSWTTSPCLRARSAQRFPNPAAPAATERRSPCSHPKQEPQPERGRLKRRERARHARDIHHARQVRHVWKSLSGPCVGDDLTANVVKETSRRHTLGARLPAAFGRSDRGPRPLVCTHGPLNDSQACQPRLVERLSHSMRVPPPFGPSVSTYRNDFQARESISAANVLRFGTGRDQASFR